MRWLAAPTDLSHYSNRVTLFSKMCFKGVEIIEEARPMPFMAILEDLKGKSPRLLVIRLWPNSFMIFLLSCFSSIESLLLCVILL